MASTYQTYQQVYLPKWEPLDSIYSIANALLTATAGTSICSDIRASKYAGKYLYYLQSATILSKYNLLTGEFITLNPSLGGIFGAGAGSVYCPSHGPRGTISAGATTTTVTFSTALPAGVNINVLKGQQIRIIDNGAGGSGKTEERIIIANTTGINNTLTLDTALSFTPVSGSTYELLTGRVYLLSSGLMSASSFRYYDVATNSFGSLSSTNLPATLTTDCSFVALDELHTPISGAGGVAVAGEIGGFFGTITATASGATSITGQSSGLDASVLANEYRNFQIRIVEDTANPTSVGQRRRITSHTAGVSPVYTVPAWTVTPSANAKFVIENNNDIILFTTASTTTYRYEWISNAWDTSTYAVRPGAMGAGCLSFHAFSGIQDTAKNYRYSIIYSFRGGIASTLDVFDIAGATTGSWGTYTAYGNNGLTTFGASAGVCYDPVSNKAMITGTELTSQNSPKFTFDVANNTLNPYRRLNAIASTPTAGNRVTISVITDGDTKKSYAYAIPSTLSTMYRSLMFT